MCLLISGKSNAIRSTLLNTKGLLHDIFSSNSDGVGAMYVTSKRKLRTPKVLPNSLAECRAFIAQLPDDDRNLALHFRMRTHGATDMTNCHPYPVIEGRIALMHNGILSQGNKADISKSDTWHYINDVVRPMLAEAPKMFLNQAWLNLIEEDISTSNRFAIMDADGELVILNKETGIEHGDLWFSNTYAWSPELLIPGYTKKFSNAKWWQSPWDRDGDREWDFSRRDYGRGTALTTTGKGSYVGNIVEKDDCDFTADDVWAALSACDPHELCDYLLDRPTFTLRTLFEDCEFIAGAEDDEYSKDDEEIVKALVDQDVPFLTRRVISCDSAAQRVAQVICWYGDWVGKAIDAKGEVGTVDAAEAELQEELDAALAEQVANENYAG